MTVSYCEKGQFNAWCCSSSSESPSDSLSEEGSLWEKVINTILLFTSVSIHDESISVLLSKRRNNLAIRSSSFIPHSPLRTDSRF